MILDAAATLPETAPEASEYRPQAATSALAENSVDTPEGNRLHYYESGAGRDVILIHGALVTADDPIIALQHALAPRHHIVAFDRPGHGLSTRPRGQSSLWTQADSIRDAASALGAARPVLVGHSFGAAVALAYAMRYPSEIAGVVAISPIAFPEPRLEHFLFGPRGLPLVGEALAASIGPLQDGLTLPLLWEAMFWPQRMPQNYRERFPFDRVRPQRRIQAEGEDSLTLVPDLTRSAVQYSTCATRVHVIASDVDLVTSPDIHARRLTRRLPNATLTIRHGLGHMLHHFAQDDVVRLVDDLLP
ncbi:MAG: alpha/beta hydrolase [Methylobacteriaceae bacterium]|nr:alpha/beta hydrolase [Methylobacteriaceae bacterium]